MPGLTERVKWNSFFAFLSQVIRLATTFVLFVGVARFYGVEGFGQFTTAHTLATIFLLLADFGFDTLLPSEISRHRENAHIYAIRFFSLKILLVLVATTAMLLVSLLHGFTGETRVLLFVFLFYVLLSSLSNFFFALFKGFEEFQHETRISFVSNLILLLLLVVIGVLGAPLYVTAMAFVLSRGMSAVLAWQKARRLSGAEFWRLDFDGWEKSWKYVMVFGFHFVFGNLFFQIDTILLALWNGDREVGIYQSVFKLATLALIVPDIAVNALIPVLSRLHQQNKEKWISIGRMLYKGLFLVSLPVSLILFVFAEQVIDVVYGGKAFGEAVPVLRVFAGTIFVRYAVDAYALMLTTARRQNVRMIIVMVGVVVNVALNTFAIPLYGPWGAALVSLFTNVFVAAGYVVFSGVSFTKWTIDVRSLVPFALTLVLCMVGWEVRHMPLLFAVPVTLSFYGILTYFLGFTPAERYVILGWKRGTL